MSGLDWEHLRLGFLALLAGLTARLGHLLYRNGAQPPEDPAALKVWKRARLWLVLAEAMSLPAIFGVVELARIVFGWSEAMYGAIMLVGGAFGYPAIIANAQKWVDSKIGTAPTYDSAPYSPPADQAEGS